MSAPDTGFGTTIQFASGFFARFRVISGAGATREKIRTSHNGTTGGYHTSIPADLAEHKPIQIEMLFDPDTEPPIDGAPEDATITFPVPAGSTNGATIVVECYLSEFEWESPYDDLMTATATLMPSGEPTWTPSS